MQFFARLETNGLAGGNADFGTGTRIAPDSSLARADTEHAKAAQFDTLTGRKSLFQALKDRINRGLRLGAGQACTLDHMMDDVLFNQWGNLVGPT
jgi:hypothetical protein